MNGSAKLLTAVLMGVTGVYCTLIYKLGESQGKSDTLHWVTEQIEAAANEMKEKFGLE